MSLAPQNALAARVDTDLSIPRHSDMSNHSDIFTRIMELFGDASEDIKSAAAFAAGQSRSNRHF